MSSICSTSSPLLGSVAVFPHGGTVSPVGETLSIELIPMQSGNSNIRGACGVGAHRRGKG